LVRTSLSGHFEKANHPEKYQNRPPLSGRQALTPGNTSLFHKNFLPLFDALSPGAKFDSGRKRVCRERANPGLSAGLFLVFFKY
jgi:hypothetical protein